MNEDEPIDIAILDALRLELGVTLARQIADFREDGAKVVVAIEEGVRARSAVAMVRPAHSLRQDALEFGALALSDLLARIEACARRGVAERAFPLEIVEDVVRLRPRFNAAVATLVRETSTTSAIWRAVGLGRRVPPERS